MSRRAGSLESALAGIPAVAFQLKLARVVTLTGLESLNPHNWLFTSNKPYRYNLAGTDCIYFSESKEVAQLEYDSYWQGLPGEYQPAATYYAVIALGRVLDLTDATALKRLKIDRHELFLPWRTAKHPTLTQRLGTAVVATGRFSAICYPSNAAKMRGKSGTNFVIFRDHVQLPDSVRILGPQGETLQQWP